MTKKLIAIDWGTTTFRAYLLNDQCKILEHVGTESGILSISDKDFETVLNMHLRQLNGYCRDIPIIASGMITSKQGWVETAYIECPADCESLSKHLTEYEIAGHSASLWFVPGVCQTTPDPDVMRGEESQIAGLDTTVDYIAVLPGTHSKWVQVEKGRIINFKTFMTGELFSLLTHHSILKSMPKDQWHEPSFKGGVQEGFNKSNIGHGLMSKIFAVRARQLLGSIPEQHAYSFLSGLMIGSEISEAFVDHQSRKIITIIGNNKLSQLYQNALNLCDIHTSLAMENLVAAGLFKIAKQKNII